MKQRAVCRYLLIPLISVCALGTALSSEWRSDKHHFSVDLPAGWNEVDPPRNEVQVVARKPDDMWTVMVMIFPSGGARELTPTFMAGIQKGYEVKGGRIQSQRFFTLKGRATGELDGRMTRDGVAIRQQMRVTIIDKKVYQMLAIGPADEELDAAVMPFFDSLRVSAKPAGTVAANSPAFPANAGLENPSDASDSKPANRIAYLAGRVVGFFVGLSLVVGVIVVVIMFIVKMASGKQPPPVRPPNFS